jgi:hypothetical protein
MELLLYEDLCLPLFGKVPPSEGYKGNYIRLTWSNESLETPPEGTIEIVMHYYTRACIMHMLRAMIFTGLIGNTVSCYFLPLLENVFGICNYSWGSTIVAYLYR